MAYSLQTQKCLSNHLSTRAVFVIKLRGVETMSQEHGVFRLKYLVLKVLGK